MPASRTPSNGSGGKVSGTRRMELKTPCSPRIFQKGLLRLPELQEAAKALPLENIVLETDAAPQPFKKYRSNWTEPRHTQDVARCLAELKGITLEEVAEATTRNLTRLLGLEHLAGPR